MPLPSQFGKQIQTQALPEWAAHYMNYKALKKVIKAQAARRTTARGGGGGAGAGSGAASGGAADAELPFLHYVDREVEKVGENESASGRKRTVGGRRSEIAKREDEAEGAGQSRNTETDSWKTGELEDRETGQ